MGDILLEAFFGCIMCFFINYILMNYKVDFQNKHRITQNNAFNSTENNCSRCIFKHVMSVSEVVIRKSDYTRGGV